MTTAKLQPTANPEPRPAPNDAELNSRWRLADALLNDLDRPQLVMLARMLATHIGYHQASAHLPADRLRRMLTDGPAHASERQALHDGNQILMKAWRVSGTSAEE